MGSDLRRRTRKSNPGAQKKKPAVGQPVLKFACVGIYKRHKLSTQNMTPDFPKSIIMNNICAFMLYLYHYILACQPKMTNF